MRVLCLGNNTEDTDHKATELAISLELENKGLLSDIDIMVDLTQLFSDAVYHTSVYDMVPGRIVLLAKHFNRVIILNQPKEEWTHPDAYLNTLNLRKFIPHIEIPGNAGFDVEYWENIVKTNKSFCIFPFIELLATNGVTTVCCRSEKEITTLANLKDFNTDRNYTRIRKDMLNGVQVEHCKKCYTDEHHGLLSSRQQETVEWANRLNLNTLDDLIQVNGPVYYEVRPSNNCNLQCRICGPMYSKLIEAEYNTLGLHDPSVTYQYSDFDFVDVNKIHKLYVAGGEPTAMPEFYKFLRNCIDQQHTNFEFLVNTNAHKVSNTLINLGSNFSNLQYIVSIDGFGLANEYSRWPSEWNNQINNITKLISNGHKVTFNIALSIYTIFSFPKLVIFLQDNFPNSLIHGQFVYGTQNPFIISYSEQLINEINSLKSTSIYIGDNLFRSFVDSVIDKARESVIDCEKLKKFFNFNDLLDKSRSVKLADYIPELEDYRNEC